MLALSIGPVFREAVHSTPTPTISHSQPFIISFFVAFCTLPVLTLSENNNNNSYKYLYMSDNFQSDFTV